LDVILSLCGIIFLAPVFITCALLIKLTDFGPIFFKQARVGKDGKKFYMYKFRSMIINAEKELEKLKELNEADGPLFKIKKDPRITAIGQLLRKTSMDELPQLINVLKGEMSLVGPRPALPSEVEQYKSWHKNRLAVPQGITGLWQVNGRSSTTFDKMMELDIEYVRSKSIFLDVYLIAMTIPALLGSKDAF
jgi:lipopolysaccharide/colanic/teichoic acid biosynthesis glycosyltransferase